VFFELQSGISKIVCEDMTLHTPSDVKPFFNDFQEREKLLNYFYF
jgi:hypothetical protein